MCTPTTYKVKFAQWVLQRFFDPLNPVAHKGIKDFGPFYSAQIMPGHVDYGDGGTRKFGQQLQLPLVTHRGILMPQGDQARLREWVSLIANFDGKYIVLVETLKKIIIG